MGLNKQLAYKYGLLFLKWDLSILPKYLLISLVTKLLCIYYVSVSMYSFLLFVFGNLFLFQRPSCDCSYLFIIFVFKNIFGLFQWISIHLGNLFQCNMFSNIYSHYCIICNPQNNWRQPSRFPWKIQWGFHH